ncbi:MAG: MAPEG family protein [Myxococcota bacterium]
MPVPVITALYAGILGLMSIVLGFQAGAIRGKKKISIGDAGDPQLLLAMRRHGNFAEWVPLTLIVIGLLELEGVSGGAIHAMGASLVVFRICHAVSLKADTIQGVGRAIGAGGSTLVLAVASVWAIVRYF